MGRFLRGESRTCPPMPQGYFDPKGEAALEAFTALARRDPDPDLVASYPEGLRPRADLVERWRAPAVAVMRNWLAYLAEHRA